MNLTQILSDFATAISPALQVLLQAVFVGLFTVAAAWVNEKLKQIRLNTAEDKRAYLDIAIGVAVKAAEQMYGTGKGQEKKDYVLAIASQTAANYGLKLDFKEIEASIEAAVFDQFPQKG